MKIIKQPFTITLRDFFNFGEIQKAIGHQIGIEDYIANNDVAMQALFATAPRNLTKELIFCFDPETEDDAKSDFDLKSWLNKEGLKFPEPMHPSMLLLMPTKISNDYLGSIGIPGNFQVILPAEQSLAFKKTEDGRESFWAIRYKDRCKKTIITMPVHSGLGGIAYIAERM